MLRIIRDSAHLAHARQVFGANDSYPVTMYKNLSSDVKRAINTRRSERVVARIRVLVHRRTDTDELMSESAYTLVVNAHGALIGLSMKAQPGELLVLKNVMSREERDSRVIRTDGSTEDQNAVAVEFVEPAPHFWQIDFPPSDWSQFQE